MAVRTQTQTLFSRISDWGVQTEAPRTTSAPTFWDGLSADEKKASVDQQRSWAFNGQYAWSPASKVCETWNTLIYPNVLKPLLKDNGKRIYHKIKKQSPYSVTCWMIGREWHSSHPAAVIICANAKVTKQAVKLVEKHGELFNWGFRVYGFESKIALNMGSPFDSLEVELKDTINICGQQFQVGSAKGKRLSRAATMGGTVIVGEEIYGLTVVHPFLKSYEDGDSSHEEESDNDDDSVGSDFASNYSDAGNPETTIEAGTAYYPSDSKELGSIPREQSFYSLESDWALVRLDNLDKSRLLLNSVILKDTVAFPSKASSGPSTRPLWAAVGTGAPIETTASDIKCGLYVPSFGFQDVWALRMAPVPGDCGSWVINAQDDSIFGVIVAGMDPDISYALPASQVCDEIKSRFPDMRFPSLRDPETLLAAARLGKTQILERVLANIDPSELNTKNSSGPTALWLACEGGHADAVRILLRTENLDPNCCGADGITPLSLAAKLGNISIFKMLLTAPGVDVNLPDKNGDTALQLAIMNYRNIITRMLMAKRGVNLNHPNINGNTALQLAIMNYHGTIARILLDVSGVNINHQNTQGDTALALAAMAGEGMIVDRLLKIRDVKVNTNNVDGKTPLALAAQGGNSGIVESFLGTGKVVVDCVDGNGNTPLILAVMSGHGSVVKSLLEVGRASVTIQNLEGNTALGIAVEKEDQEIVQLLLNHKEDYTGASPGLGYSADSRTPSFPEKPHSVREDVADVAPLKDVQKKGIPPNARWTKLSRRIVDPAALEEGKERFEERSDYIIVLRVLTKEEIQAYADRTHKIRNAWRQESVRDKRRQRDEANETSKAIDFSLHPSSSSLSLSSSLSKQDKVSLPSRPHIRYEEQERDHHHIDPANRTPSSKDPGKKQLRSPEYVKNELAGRRAHQEKRTPIEVSRSAQVPSPNSSDTKLEPEKKVARETFFLT